MGEESKRNCNTCKFGILRTCETLKKNEEYQEIIKDKSMFNMEKYNFKENFICDNYKSRYIEYPLEVSKINNNTDKKGLRDSQIGKFAKIAPCGEEYKGKTYLGLYLGDLPIGNYISHNSETKELNVSFDTNPAIFVFDLNKIIYGCESWWGIIEKEEDLKDITNADINNVWYVKALKSMSNKENGLKVFMVGDSDWYASPYEVEEFICWFRDNIDNSDTFEVVAKNIEECDLDNDCMWYETNDKKDIEELGDYDERCKGGIGDLRKGIEDKNIVEKLMSFREVIKLQGHSKEPYLIATTNN